MPVLPIIDLLIFLGWTTIMVGAVLKAIYLTTSYRPTFLGLAPLDLLLIAGVFLVFALSLAARTWVKANEPKLLAARKRPPASDEQMLGFLGEEAPGNGGPLETREGEAPGVEEPGRAVGG
jgi:hypothetical protein